MVYFPQRGESSAALAREWLEEMRETPKDGHDQMPLRKVLWRHRDDEVLISP